MSIPEIIARLDTLERALLGNVSELRELRLELFATLDSDPDALVD